MGNEILGAAGDPGEVADAQLLRIGERGRQREARRVSEAAGALSSVAQRLSPLIDASADRLGERKIEAKQFATVVRTHAYIVTAVDALARQLR